MAKSANAALAKLALGIAAVAALAGVTGKIAMAEQTSPFAADAQPGGDSFFGQAGNNDYFTDQGGDTFGGQDSQQSAILAPQQPSTPTVKPSVPQTRTQLPSSTRTRHSRRG